MGLLDPVSVLYVVYDAYEADGVWRLGNQYFFVCFGDLIDYSEVRLAQCVGFPSHPLPASCCHSLLSTDEIKKGKANKGRRRIPPRKIFSKCGKTF